MDEDTKKDILFFLENQNKMYEMTLNHSSCGFAQKQGINILKKRLTKLIEKLENGKS